jgi:ABC-2 type transport system ATP-binding protein
VDIQHLLELRGASKSYRRAGAVVTALHALDLALQPGERVGLLGPNGSGKTTAVKLISGLCSADAGTLHWRGRAHPLGEHAQLLRELGVLLEGRGAGYERLSTVDNARYFCVLRESRFDRDHFDALARLLEIPDVHAPLRQLSTGNKLRASLLVTLIHRPALLLLDEPTLGLDLFGVDRLEDLIRRTTEQGTAVVLGSHDLHFIERLSQRIVCLRLGHKVYDGATTDFLRIDHEVVLLLDTGGAPPPVLPPALGLPAWQLLAEDGGSFWQLHLRDHAQVCAVLAALQPVLADQQGLQLRQVSLRDKYLQLVGGSK